MKLNVRVAKRGAVLHANLRGSIMAQAMIEAEGKVAYATMTEIKAELGRVLQHPTGYYESRVVADVHASPPIVHDSGVIYGPWLEGIGSRNATTRFKGYSTFRRVAQRMQSKVVEISGPVFARAVRDLNR